MNKRITKEDFSKKANLIQGDKYDYSLVVYKNSYSKIKILCKEHGEFEQTPKNHLKGQGCPKCGIIKKNLSNRKNTSWFINKAKQIHSEKYDYSLVDYVISKTKIKIICKEHGEFEQIANDHLNGYGCPKCGKNKKLTTSEFIKSANKIHNNKYDYSLIMFSNAKNCIEIVCNKHGIFKQRLDHHLNGCGCPICRESKGERKIRNWLELNNIKFEFQKTFKDCKNKKVLPFDFYLPEKNILIEYDGIQHFNEKNNFGGKNNLSKIQKNDKIKNNFAKENNINMIRISYTLFDEIEKLLSYKL